MPGETYRRRVANLGDQVLGQGQDQRTLSVVTLANTPAPDYTKSGDAVTAKGVVIGPITADMDNPNTSAPTAARTVKSEHYGFVAFHVVLPATGTGNVEVWVDAGKDAAGDAIGWLLVHTITGVVSRREYLAPVGQRLAYIRLTGTANVDGGNPATVRATGVV